MRSTAALALAACGALAAASAGCSFSYSSASISDSITGSSTSVSDSLGSSSSGGSSDSEEAYREDVRDYTAGAARSGSGMAEFQTGLARVAERHGVTNWEADGATWVGIGEGLGRAGIDPAAVQHWSDALARDEPGGPPAGRLILQGYEASRS